MLMHNHTRMHKTCTTHTFYQKNGITLYTLFLKFALFSIFDTAKLYLYLVG